MNMNMDVDPIEIITKILRLWAQTLNQIRIRDRTVKAIQYGCQMVMGYYGSKLKEDVSKMLSVARRTASTSRRAFWLLKSVNHIGTFIEMIMDLQNCFTLPKFLDLLEQFFLIIYYFFENITFLIRVNAFTSITENYIEDYINWSGFGGDLACFLSVFVSYVQKLLNWKRLKDLLISNRNLLANNSEKLEEENIVSDSEIFDTSISLVVVSYYCLLF